MKYTYSYNPAQFAKEIKDIYRPIAKAGTAAIKQVGADVKAAGRADIASAGFSKKWQNALRVNVYPKSGNSANAAAWIYHKIIYAGVFETGAQIQGKPMLWIPMSHIPKRISGKRMSVKNYQSEIGRLQYVRSKKGRSLLLGKVAGDGKDVTIANLRRGHKAALAKSRKGKAAAKPHMVPIFVGVSSVSIRKRFNIRRVIANGAAKLGRYYVQFSAAEG